MTFSHFAFLKKVSKKHTDQEQLGVQLVKWEDDHIRRNEHFCLLFSQ